MPPRKHSIGRFEASFRLLGGSPEWIAGLRLHSGAAVAVISALVLCACVPYAGFPALYLAAIACGAFYRSNEPVQLLLLPEKSAARLIAHKVFAAWRNYFLFTTPYAAAIVLLHPGTRWMTAAWAPLAALALLYFVVTKYARYQPGISPRWPLAARLGAAGFLVPPLLPLSLWLTVVYTLGAERNLNRYLHDYD